MKLSLILFILGILLIIISAILLYRFIKKGSELSVKDFDNEFQRSSSLNPVKVELSGERKKLANQLNIVADFDSKPVQNLEFEETIETEKLTK